MSLQGQIGGHGTSSTSQTPFKTFLTITIKNEVPRGDTFMLIAHFTEWEISGIKNP